MIAQKFFNKIAEREDMSSKMFAEFNKNKDFRYSWIKARYKLDQIRIGMFPCVVRALKAAIKNLEDPSFSRQDALDVIEKELGG